MVIPTEFSYPLVCLTILGDFSRPLWRRNAFFASLPLGGDDDGDDDS